MDDLHSNKPNLRYDRRYFINPTDRKLNVTNNLKTISQDYKPINHQFSVSKQTSKKCHLVICSVCKNHYISTI